MRRRTLTELASNPDLISGIYNYCDRWCERCPFTSRCLVFATEQAYEDDSPESHDIRNAAFWQKLSSIFQETKEMIQEWAEETGVDLSQVPDDDDAEVSKRRRQQVDHHRLAKAGKKYAAATTDWFREVDQLLEVSDVEATESDIEATEQVRDAREIILWYQYQIAVKTMRALSGRDDEREFQNEIASEALTKDSDGSVKVALIGIDRSIAAWRLMQLSLTDRADSIVPLILQLERLRHRLEKEFPNARDFIRPGFDENLGAAN